MGKLIDYKRQIKVIDKKLKISCIVPAYNEQDLLEKFLFELNSTLKSLTHHFEIILVDDGSTDNTLSIACQHPIKILSFSRNFGKEVAITAGLEHANGEVVIIIDGDFQHPIDQIKTFIDHWSQGYDMVYGVQEKRQHESFLKKFFTKSFYTLMRRITQTKIPADAGDFRLLDRNVVNAINQCTEYHRFMKGLYSWVGFKAIGIPFTAKMRPLGKSKFRVKGLAELALTGITSFSSIPLRVWSLVGLVISSISFAYGLYILIKTLIFGVDVPGFATITVAIMFFGGIQLLSIGILGEYIGRIFDEVKKRPKYFVKKKIGFKNNKNINAYQEERKFEDTHV